MRSMYGTGLLWAAMPWRARVVALGLVVLAGCAPRRADVAPAIRVATPVEPTQQLAPTPTVSAFKGSVIVEAAEQYFYPEQVTISPGTTVLWKDVQGTHDMVAE